jgi:HK97 family phage prohead protease
MFTKGFDVGFKDMDIHKGIVTGYFAMFNNKDLDGDVIERGAFAKTVQERGPKGKQLIKYLLDHDKNKVVAKINELYEDEKGLYYEAKIGTHALGQDFMKMIESDLINQHSFGFKTIKEEYDSQAKANRLKELMMYEGSAIQFLGANPETNVIGLKSPEDYIAYFEKLEKFVKTSDASDETLIILTEKIKSLHIYLEPASTTPEVKEADEHKQIIELLKNFGK